MTKACHVVSHLSIKYINKNAHFIISNITFVCISEYLYSFIGIWKVIFCYRAALIMLYFTYEEDSVLVSVVVAGHGFRAAFYKL